MSAADLTMSGGEASGGEAAEANLRLRRLELDNEDLRAENARLKGSIAQRQEEILRLGERLADLQASLIPGPPRPLRVRLRPANLLRALRRRAGI